MLTKIVDGIEEVLSAAEESEILAEWAANAGKIIVPTIVTMKQARLALLDAGLLPTVNSAIAGLTGSAGDAARIEWEFSADIHRGDDLVTQISGGLGLTSTQIDALFISASLK